MPSLSFRDAAAALWPPSPNLNSNSNVEGLKSANNKIQDSCGGVLGDAGAGAMEMSENSGLRKRGAEGLLEWLREIAVDPTEEMLGDCEMEMRVLRVRKSLFVRLGNEDTKLVFPSCKKTGKRSSEELWNNDTENIGLDETVNQPRRRSERLVHVNKSLSQHLLSRCKRVGVGPTFQADVPERTCHSGEQNVSGAKKDWNDLRCLGLRIWPLGGDDKKNNEVVVGKGRHSVCACSCPGSVSCIYSHVRTSTHQLKADLGQAFFDWGFDRMGEEVAASWTADEQVKFGALERLETGTEFNNFWEIAEKYFRVKSKGELISYYFNVFLLRRMRNLSRLAPEEINSDEEDDINEDINEKSNEKVRDRVKGKSRKKHSSTSS